MGRDSSQMRVLHVNYNRDGQKIQRVPRWDRSPGKTSPIERFTSQKYHVTPRGIRSTFTAQHHTKKHGWIAPEDEELEERARVTLGELSSV